MTDPVNQFALFDDAELIHEWMRLSRDRGNDLGPIREELISRGLIQRFWNVGPRPMHRLTDKGRDAIIRSRP